MLPIQFPLLASLYDPAYLRPLMPVPHTHTRWLPPAFLRPVCTQSIVFVEMGPCAGGDGSGYRRLCLAAGNPYLWDHGLVM